MRINFYNGNIVLFLPFCCHEQYISHATIRVLPTVTLMNNTLSRVFSY